MAPQPSSGGPLKPPHATRVHDTSSGDRGIRWNKWMIDYDRLGVGRVENGVDFRLS